MLLLQFAAICCLVFSAHREGRRLNRWMFFSLGLFASWAYLALAPNYGTGIYHDGFAHPFYAELQVSRAPGVPFKDRVAQSYADFTDYISRYVPSVSLAPESDISFSGKPDAVECLEAVDMGAPSEPPVTETLGSTSIHCDATGSHILAGGRPSSEESSISPITDANAGAMAAHEGKETNTVAAVVKTSVDSSSGANSTNVPMSYTLANAYYLLVPACFIVFLCSICACSGYFDAFCPVKHSMTDPEAGSGNSHHGLTGGFLKLASMGAIIRYPLITAYFITREIVYAEWLVVTEILFFATWVLANLSVLHSRPCDRCATTAPINCRYALPASIGPLPRRGDSGALLDKLVDSHQGKATATDEVIFKTNADEGTCAERMNTPGSAGSSTRLVQRWRSSLETPTRAFQHLKRGFRFLRENALMESSGTTVVSSPVNKSTTTAVSLELPPNRYLKGHSQKCKVDNPRAELPTAPDQRKLLMLILGKASAIEIAMAAKGKHLPNLQSSKEEGQETKAAVQTLKTSDSADFSTEPAVPSIGGTDELRDDSDVDSSYDDSMRVHRERCRRKAREWSELVNFGELLAMKKAECDRIGKGLEEIQNRRFASRNELGQDGSMNIAALQVKDSVPTTAFPLLVDDFFSPLFNEANEHKDFMTSSVKGKGKARELPSLSSSSRRVPGNKGVVSATEGRID